MQCKRDNYINLEKRQKERKQIGWERAKAHKKTIAELNQKLERGTKDLYTCKKMISNLKTEKDRMEAGIPSKILKMIRQKEMLSADATSLVAQAHKIEQTISKSTLEIADRSRELQRLKKQVKTCETHIVKLKSIEPTHTRQCEDAKTQSQGLLSKFKEIDKSYRENIVEADRLDNVRHQKASHLRDLQWKLSKLKKNMANLQQLMKVKTGRLNALKDEACTVESGMELEVEAAPASPKDKSLASLQKEDEALTHREAGLREREEHDVDKDALKRFKDIENDITKLSATREETQKDFVAMTNVRKGLYNERFEYLTKSLDSINENLAQIWRFVSPYGGECYINFHREPVTLFAEGVTLCCRWPKQGFLEFKNLSGGQQALAAVVLSVSLQRVSPMPFYIMDEIDASLDSENVSKVTKLLLNESEKGVQYVLVTHRPEMYEQCNRMVGIYSLQGSSKCVSIAL